MDDGQTSAAKAQDRRCGLLLPVSPPIGRDNRVGKGVRRLLRQVSRTLQEKHQRSDNIWRPFLLDECVPRRLKRDLVGHDVRTAPEMGWASKRNGELLALAVGQFEVFLTADRNVSYQQDPNEVSLSLHKNDWDLARRKHFTLFLANKIR